MTVRTAWLLPQGQTREDTRLAPLGTMAPADALGSRPGVIAGGDPLAATGVGAMQLQISTGRAVVQGTAAQGAYPVAVTAPETVAVADGDAQYARVDTVALRVLDGLYDTSEQTAAMVEIVQGAPSATPSAPPLSAAALPLWDIAVPAGASAGVGGIDWSRALTDRRAYTAAYGGILPRGGASTDPGAYPGQYRDNGTGLERWDGDAWQQIDPRIGWTAAGLAGGYSNNGNGQGTVRYRRIVIAGVPHVQWRGGVSWSTSGSPPGGGFILASPVPSAYRPARLASIAVAAGGVPIKADFQVSGQLQLITTPGVTTWVSVTGVQYPLDT
ncbi:hypothetical protein [Streptomyces celluloflavus]|uniref:hypothetical protein n=1 Tax=Streptomyces celluloflavus TaxID=58344 RepID=UPI00364F2401